MACLRLELWMRARWGVALLGLSGGLSCVDLEGPPSIAVQACRYYEACEPAFILAFTGLDACIETLEENTGLFDACGASEDTLEDCRIQLGESISTCEPIDQRACERVSGCRNQECASIIGSTVATCDAEINLEGLLAVCEVGGDQGICVAGCLANAGCSPLENYPASILSSCLYTCQVF